METFIEILGYLGMALVVLSFTMKNIVLLRVINILGALLSGIYGYITKIFSYYITKNCVCPVSRIHLFITDKWICFKVDIIKFLHEYTYFHTGTYNNTP